MPEIRGVVRSHVDAPKPGASDDAGALLTHLFDYCLSLVGREDDALDTARFVMASADARIDDPGRRRAWLFALARRHAVALLPFGSNQPSYAAPSSLVSAGLRHSVMEAFGALPDSDREILDLVYRHGIRPPDLAAVLAIEAGEAYHRLVNAEGEFIALAGATGAEAGANLDDIADLPLATLPAPAVGHWWPRSRQRPTDGTAGLRRRALARRRALLVAAAVILLGAPLAWVVAYLAPPGHVDGSPGAPVVTGGAANSPGQQARAPAVPPRHNRTPAIPITVLLPVPGRSAGISLPPPFINSSPTPTSAPSTSPSPTSQPSDSPPPQPSDSPTPTPQPSDSPTPPASTPPVSPS